LPAGREQLCTAAKKVSSFAALLSETAAGTVVVGSGVESASPRQPFDGGPRFVRQPKSRRFVRQHLEHEPAGQAALATSSQRPATSRRLDLAG
jgi:hypothetical protein